MTPSTGFLKALENAGVKSVLTGSGIDYLRLCLYSGAPPDTANNAFGQNGGAKLLQFGAADGALVCSTPTIGVLRIEGPAGGAVLGSGAVTWWRIYTAGDDDESADTGLIWPRLQGTDSELILQEANVIDHHAYQLDAFEIHLNGTCAGVLSATAAGGAALNELIFNGGGFNG